MPKDSFGASLVNSGACFCLECHSCSSVAWLSSWCPAMSVRSSTSSRKITSMMKEVSKNYFLNGSIGPSFPLFALLSVKLSLVSQVKDWVTHWEKDSTLQSSKRMFLTSTAPKQDSFFPSSALILRLFKTVWQPMYPCLSSLSASLLEPWPSCSHMMSTLLWSSSLWWFPKFFARDSALNSSIILRLPTNTPRVKWATSELNRFPMFALSKHLVMRRWLAWSSSRRARKSLNTDVHVVTSGLFSSWASNSWALEAISLSFSS